MDTVKDDPNKFVRVTDMAGKEYICPLNALRDPESCTAEELTHCFNSAEEAFTDDEARAIMRSAVKKIP